MTLPYKKLPNFLDGTKILQIEADEVCGNLFISAVYGTEERKAVYDGMYYSQLDETAVGLVIKTVSEISPEGLELPKYIEAAARLYDECGADDIFVNDLYLRGNRFFVHNTENGVFIVIARNLTDVKRNASDC